MSVLFDDLVREVRESLRGFGLVQDRVAFLTANVTNSGLSITVDDASNVDPGVVEVNGECIFVRSKAGNVLTVAPDGRGWQGTTAAAHSTNDRLVCDPGFPTWRIQRAINDAITGVYPMLWGTASTTFVFNASNDTYSLPADCEGILSVTFTDIGPSKAQVQLHGYKFEPNADTDTYATGRTIQLREAPTSGRTVKVNYRKAPSELTTGQALTASGLRDTARRCIVYGALAEILSMVDATRALTDSAANYALDDYNGVGKATQLAAQLTARYQMELDAEVARVRQQHKPSVVWRGR